MTIDSEKLKAKIEELRADSQEAMQFNRMMGMEERYLKEMGYSLAYLVVLNLIEKLEKENEIV